MEATVRKIGNLSIKVVTDRTSTNNSIITERDVEMDSRAIAAVRDAINRAIVCKKTIAKYDPTLKKAYVEYSNGERKYVE